MMPFMPALTIHETSYLPKGEESITEEWMVLLYFADVTAFALSVLDDWRHQAAQVDLSTESVDTLWKAGGDNLIVLGKALADVEADVTAVSRAAETTHTTLLQFADVGLALLRVIAQQSNRDLDYADLDLWCCETREHVTTLLIVCERMREFRAKLPANVGEEARHEPMVP